MDLDELQSVQSRERQTDSLQRLRESFYQDAGEYITELREERERVAERADDPWNNPEISRLSDDIETAESTVEAIYERRVGKIVKMASLAAAEMPTDDDGLTAEERRLFEALVSDIESNRDRVEAILDGLPPSDAESDAAAPSDPTGATDAVASGDEPNPAESGAAGDRTDGPSDRDAPPAGVDAADLMGDEPGGEEVEPPDPERRPPDGSNDPDDDRVDGEAPQGRAATGDAQTAGEGALPAGHEVQPETSPGTDAGTDPPAEGGPASSGSSRSSGTVGVESDATAAATESGATSGATAPGAAEVTAESDTADANPDVARSTVRITTDVGEIFGVDERSYDLSASDVVTLPEANADPLVERDAAERLD